MSNNQELPELTIGASFVNTGTVYSGDPQSAYNASGATIKAVVTNKSSSQVYCDEVMLDSGATGADWGNGVIVFNFTPTITAQIANFVSRPQNGMIELRIETADGDVFFWYDEIYIRPGNIS